MIFLKNYHYSILLLITVPLIIHLLIKSRKDVIIYPSLIFLKDTLSKKNNKIRFSQTLLLIIRTLIVGFLVFAGTQPVIKTVFPFKSSFSVYRDYIIILDNSLSMQLEKDGVTYFDRMKDKLISFIEKLNKYDKVTLLLTAKESYIHGKPFSSVTDELKEQYLSLDKGYGRGNLKGCYKKARELLSLSEGKHKSIIIFSDFQLNECENFLSQIDNEDTYLVTAPDQQNKNISNFFIKNLNIKSSKINNDSSSLNFQTHHTGEKKTTPHLIIKNGENVIFNKSIDFSVQDRIDFSIPINHYKEKQTFEFHLSGDDFYADNKQGIIVGNKPEINILIKFNKELKNQKYLQYLFSDPSNNNSLFKTSFTENLSELNSLSPFDCMFLNDPVNISSFEKNRLKKWIKNGGTAFFCLNNNNAIDEYSYNSELIPFKLVEIENTDNRSNFQILLTDDSSILLDKYFNKYSFSKVHKSIFGKTENQQNNQNILITENNEPYLSLYQYGKGYFLWFFSTMNEEFEDIIYNKAFLPLIHILCENLTIKKRKRGYKFAEEKNIISPPYPDNVVNESQVLKPKLFSDNTFGIVPVKPGIMKLIFKEKEEILHINTNSLESELTFTKDFSNLEKAQIIDLANDSIISYLAKEDGQFALWRLLFIIIFILLCLENIITKVLRP